MTEKRRSVLRNQPRSESEAKRERSVANALGVPNPVPEMELPLAQIEVLFCGRPLKLDYRTSNGQAEV